MSSRKLLPDASSDPSSLVVVAIANAFGLGAAVFMAANISGGHVNPTVTLKGGWRSQCVGTRPIFRRFNEPSFCIWVKRGCWDFQEPSSVLDWAHIGATIAGLLYDNVVNANQPTATAGGSIGVEV
uniref:Uncharacterized protein n=1 Tax=Cannabis sativa TaxID=3483 RepID=A0A803NU01_CANSA